MTIFARRISRPTGSGEQEIAAKILRKSIATDDIRAGRRREVIERAERLATRRIPPCISPIPGAGQKLIDSPARGVKRLKVDNRRNRILTEAEQQALLAACPKSSGGSCGWR